MELGACGRDFFRPFLMRIELGSSGNAGRNAEMEMASEWG